MATGTGDVRNKGKGEADSITGHYGQRRSRGTTVLSLTAALYGVGGKRHAPAALPRERGPLPNAQ